MYIRGVSNGEWYRQANLQQLTDLRTIAVQLYDGNPTPELAMAARVLQAAIAVRDGTAMEIYIHNLLK